MKIPVEFQDLLPISFASLSCFDEKDDKIKAHNWKESGNKQFSLGAFEDSAHNYSKSIELDPTVAATFNNRAAARIKIYLKSKSNIDKNLLELAIEDCNKAIALDGNYAKAFVRRAQAERLLGRLVEALDTCDMCEERGVPMSLFRSHLQAEILASSIQTLGLSVIQNDQEREIVRLLLRRSGVEVGEGEIENIPPAHVHPRAITHEAKDVDASDLFPTSGLKKSSFMSSLNKLNKKTAPKAKAKPKSAVYSGLNSTSIAKNSGNCALCSICIMFF